MSSWILLAVTVVIALPVIRLVWRRRSRSSDLDPVSTRWLADQKRIADEAHL